MMKILTRTFIFAVGVLIALGGATIAMLGDSADDELPADPRQQATVVVSKADDLLQLSADTDRVLILTSLLSPTELGRISQVQVGTVHFATSANDAQLQSVLHRKLVSLHLTDCTPITPQTFSMLNRSPLVDLQILRGGPTVEIFQAIGRLRQLKLLNIPRGGADAAQITAALEASTLEHLTLSATKFTTADFNQLRLPKSVVGLLLRDVDEAPIAIESLFAGPKNVKYVGILGPSDWREGAIKSLLSECSPSTLLLSGKLSALDLDALSGATSLRELILLRAGAIPLEFSTRLGRLPSLTAVTMGDCSGVTIEHLASMLVAPSLQAIALYACTPALDASAIDSLEKRDVTIDVVSGDAGRAEIEFFLGATEGGE